MLTSRIPHVLRKVIRSATAFSVVAGGLVTHSAHAAASQILHEFNAYPQGTAPSNGVVVLADGTLYGTAGGGAFGRGIIFRVAPDGTRTIVYNFAGGSGGANPSGKLVLGPDGNLYGTTWSGGATSRNGTVYQLNPITLAVSYLHAFSAASDLASPAGALAIGTDKALYGIASRGGVNGFGGVYRCTTTGDYTIIHSFATSQGVFFDVPALLAASDGYLYGTTASGGRNGNGMIYKMSMTGTLTDLHDFGTPEGYWPTSSLIMGSDRKLWGTTNVGGPKVGGVIYSMATNGTGFSIIYGFDSSGDHSPSALVAGPGGKYYGISYAVSAAGQFSRIFSLTANGQYAVVHAPGPDEGGSLSTNLFLAPGGTFYGSVGDGGTNRTGSLFKLTANGTFTEFSSFPPSNGGGTMMPPVTASDGNFYGVVTSGGVHDRGYVYRMSAKGVISILYEFGSSESAFFGYFLQGADGQLYGTAWDSTGYLVYRVSLSGAYSVFCRFTTQPSGIMMLARDGSFYGVADRVVYKISTSGVETPIASVPFGMYPHSVVLAADGNLYAVTQAGGTTNNPDLYGSIIRITPAGVVSRVYTFTNGADGSTPFNDLCLGSDGNVYGTTHATGGSHGTIFRYVPGGAFTTVMSIPATSVWSLSGPPLLAQDGTVYVPARDPDSNNAIFAGRNAVGLSIISNPPPSPGDGTGFPVYLALNSDGGLYGSHYGGGAYGNGLIFKVASNATSFQHAVAIASGTDSHTHALWLNVAGESSLWNINDAASQYTHRDFNGAPGEARFIASGPDGKTRVAYIYGNNIITLRSVDENTGATRENVFRSLGGLPVKAISVGGDNRTRLVLGATNGDISLVTVNEADWSYTQKAFTHPAGATFVGAATGSGNHTHVVWSKGAGAITLWDIDPAGTVTSVGFAANSKWIPAVVSVGADNKTRVGWSNSRGEFLLWIVQDGVGVPTEKTFASPGRYTLTSLSTSSDGKTHAAWTTTNGRLLLWAINETAGTHTDSVFAP